MTRVCEFQGGAGRPEKYRPSQPCLGEFEVRPQNAHRSKYCKVCAPFAKKALSAENANARYKAEPEKFAKITRRNRWKRAKAAGRSCRRMGSIQRCQYRDKRGRRGEGCLGKFALKSSFQKFCDSCQKHADADRARASRIKYRAEINRRDRDRAKRQRDLADRMKQVESGAAALIGADRVITPKGGRPADTAKAARIEELVNDGMEWAGIQKQIAEEFRTHTTVNALQKLLRRHIERRTGEGNGSNPFLKPSSGEAFRG